MKSLVELFWFKYSQLKHAVQSEDEGLVSILDREIEPALASVFRQEAKDNAELREQFQVIIDLLRDGAGDEVRVIRHSSQLESLLDRYFGTLTSPKTEVSSGLRPLAVRNGNSEPADDGLLNEAILDSLPDRVAVITTDYRYLYSNTANARRFNEKPIDLVGRHIVEYIGIQRFESRVKPSLDRCFSGETVEYTYLSSRQPGAAICCRMTPCRSNAGNILGAIMTLHESRDRRGHIAA